MRDNVTTFDVLARELYNEIEQIEKHINLDVKSIQNQKPAARIQLSNQVAEIFEKWRRGQR